MEKRREVVNTFDKNYLLEAGAGAGKTTIIVERIINHIVNSDIDPSNLVAITFTKAAATELAERIQMKALEYIKMESDPKIIDRLRDVDKIFTGTIHSFCDLILREMPFYANLSPGYEIVEDDKEFHRKIWYNFLRDREEEYKKKREMLQKFNIDYMDLRTRAILALENIDIKFTGYDNGDYTYEDIEKEFENIKNDYGDLEYKDISKGKAIGKLLYGILEEKGKLDDYLNNFKNSFGKGKFDLDRLFSEIHKKSSVFNEEDRYKSFIEELYGIYTNLKAIPYNICTDFINMVVDYKKENYKGKLTFNELLYRASTLVKSSQNAREHLKNKYKYFYLDESQDTDPMQIELIMCLVHKDSEYTRIKSWYDISPRAGSLFIVGDPKQSIYRFRRADISIYNEMKRLIDKNGEVVYLDINFRSSDEICNWVQSTFKKGTDEGFGFNENATDIQAGFNRILSQWDDSIDREIESHFQGAYSYTSEKRDEEYISNLVNYMLKNGIITEKVKENEKYYNKSRKIEPGDIMILTKANEETGFYLSALKDKGIPALLAGEKSLGDTREVLNLFTLIDALVDHKDSIKVVSVLRNSFYLDLETIELFMEEEKNLSKYMFSLEEIKKIEHPSIKRAFIHINETVKLSRELSPIAFVERIIDNRIGVYKVDREYDKLELRDANSSLRQVVEILKTRECYSIYRLREELKSLIENKVKYELPISREEAIKALRIMNIHKAKGLEANIVILVGGDKKRFVSNDTHYVEKSIEDESIGYMKYNSKFNIKGPDEDYKKERENTFKEAEIDRLLYVAATRAKSVLIVAKGSEEESFLYPLSININREIKINREVGHKAREVNISKPKEEERIKTRELRIKKEIYNSSYVISSPSSFKGSYYYEEKKEEMEIKSLKLKAAKQIKATDNIRFKFGPRGKVYGTIVHRAIEHLINETDNMNSIGEERIDYSINFAIDEVLDSIEINKTNIGLFYPGQIIKVEKIVEINIKEGREKSLYIIKKRLYEYVKDVLLQFVNNEDIKELFQNAEKIFTEIPFTIGVDQSNMDLMEKVLDFMRKDKAENIRRNNKTILINGVIDLVIKSKEGIWTILDYKTDKPLREKDDLSNYLRQSYTSQLKGYKLFFEEITKNDEIKVDNLLLYSTYMDQVVAVNREQLAEQGSEL